MKNISSKRIKFLRLFCLAVIWLSCTSVFAYGIMSYYSASKQWEGSFKISSGSVNKFLKVTLKENPDTNRKKLLNYNFPFIDKNLETDFIQETQTVTLDQTELQGKDVSSLHKCRFLNINYRVYLLAKNGVDKDNLLLIDTKQDKDIKTNIMDGDVEKQSTIFPAEVQYKKVGSSNNSRVSSFNSFTDYNDASSGLPVRPEMFIPKSKTNISSSDEYRSYDIVMKIYLNIPLDKETVSDILKTYNVELANNSLKTRNYEEFADNDQDTPNIIVFVDYDLVDESGKQIIENYSFTRGRSGMKFAKAAGSTSTSGRQKIHLNITHGDTIKNIDTQAETITA